MRKVSLKCQIDRSLSYISCFWDFRWLEVSWGQGLCCLFFFFNRHNPGTSDRTVWDTAYKLTLCCWLLTYLQESLKSCHCLFLTPSCLENSKKFVLKSYHAYSEGILNCSAVFIVHHITYILSTNSTVYTESASSLCLVWANFFCKKVVSK